MPKRSNARECYRRAAEAHDIANNTTDPITKADFPQPQALVSHLSNPIATSAASLPAGGRSLLSILEGSHMQVEDRRMRGELEIEECYCVSACNFDPLSGVIGVQN
jgi:hypothetical protein